MSKHHESPMGHCLGCVTVRNGVLAFSYFILFLSLCSIAGLVSEDPRILVGGYAPWSNWLVDITGGFGIVLAAMSIIGVYDHHEQWVKWFAYFAAVRTFVYIFVFWSDWQMLLGCEKFGLSSLNQGYNAAMENVVLHGKCQSTRVWYGIIAASNILISAYGVWNALFWVKVMENGPRYHISLDDSKPLRIYTGYSSIGHPDAPPAHVLSPSGGLPEEQFVVHHQHPPVTIAMGPATMAPMPVGQFYGPPQTVGYGAMY